MCCRRDVVLHEQQQHAVCDIGQLLAHDVREVSDGGAKECELRGASGDGSAALLRGAAAGGLHSGAQPARVVLPDWVWQKPYPSAPPRGVAAVRESAPPEDPVHAGVPLVQQPKAQRQPRHRRRAGRAGPERQLPRRPLQLRPDRAHHLHQRPHRGRAQRIGRRPTILLTHSKTTDSRGVPNHLQLMVVHVICSRSLTLAMVIFSLTCGNGGLTRGMHLVPGFFFFFPA
jgi:hypothetical protein